MKPFIKIRLRRFVGEANFRCSDATLFDSIPRKERLSLRGNEAICFISKGGDQLLFCFRRTSVGISPRGNRLAMLPSYRLRVPGGVFNPAMLANYAADAGFELEGIKRFEERYAKLKAANSDTKIPATFRAVRGPSLSI